MTTGNSEMVSLKMIKARKTLDEIAILVENELWHTAINRMYYACFYATTALLASIDIHTKTHNGAKQMLGQHFVKTGKVSESLNDYYAELFHMRQSADYEDVEIYEKEDVLQLVAPAHDFISEIEKLLSK